MEEGSGVFTAALSELEGWPIEARLRLHFRLIHAITILAREWLFVGPADLTKVQFCKEAIHVLAGSAIGSAFESASRPETVSVLAALCKKAADSELGQDFERIVVPSVTIAD